MAMNVKKGDTVIVLSGKDKGKQGKVLGTVPSEAKVVVEGINKGRSNQMPAFKDLLAPGKIQVLAAYVWSLSNAPKAAPASK